MADAKKAAFSKGNAALSPWPGDEGLAMVEILFMAQLVRSPLEAIARRWYCKSLFRATRGKRRCEGCTAS
jgi:hypothetical protein